MKENKQVELTLREKNMQGEIKHWIFELHEFQTVRQLWNLTFYNKESLRSLVLLSVEDNKTHIYWDTK